MLVDCAEGTLINNLYSTSLFILQHKRINILAIEIV
jgi:hypothetical protein